MKCQLTKRSHFLTGGAEIKKWRSKKKVQSNCMPTLFIIQFMYFSRALKNGLLGIFDLSKIMF